MKRQTWKTFAVAGLFGLAGLGVGCTEREERRMGEEVEEVGTEVEEEFEEGTGGAGPLEDAEIGDNEGVINDGEGPFEQNDQRGQDTVFQEGEGPLEENTER